jgi:protein SCO1/2
MYALVKVIGGTGRCAGRRFVPLFVIVLLAGTIAASATAGEAGHPTDSGTTGAAPDPHAHHRAMLSGPATDAAAGVSIQLHDRLLLTQNGEAVRFATEVVGERIVVMDFVYTTCNTVCPVLSAIFGQLQQHLGERLGREVYLVSISVDPVRDTPQRLKAYAKQHHGRDGWLWLTGEKPAVDEVLQGLGAYTPDFEDHPSMVLVGDGATGSWKRFFGFPGPAQILAAVDELAAARQAAAIME